MDLPRTVLGVNSACLLELEDKAVDLGFSQCLPPEQLRRHLAPDAIHYLLPAFVHILKHRPDVSPQWRCEALLTMNDDMHVLSLLDVLPTTFAQQPETLTLAQKTDAVQRMQQAPSISRWLDDHA
ncbi:hypothetical protein ABN034_29950 [Actinopolymorpha sp. B11F2]|uniref:hypothetical protein n=1 Tax=Actinopolymorpha sp. B11F2 TaxID=3160862 RepID=UPI0032E3DB1A